HLVADQPISTFSIDVDTGAYANVRRFLNAGQLPPQDAVRVEEMVNYFDYSYVPPASRDVPFRVATEVAPAPWNPQALLMKIGIKGFGHAGDEPHRSAHCARPRVDGRVRRQLRRRAGADARRSEDQDPRSDRSPRSRRLD